MIEGLKFIPRIIVPDNRGKSCKLYSKGERDMDELYLSYSKKNVIRGIHFQEEPYSQGKVVTVLKGKIKDVVIDLRPYSKTFLSINAFDLEEGEDSLLIPKGCGHGFLTLDKENIVLYEIEGKYKQDSERGILWNSIDYQWNIENPIISDHDRELLTLERYLREIG